MSDWLDLEALWQVVVASLAAGAGLAAAFSLALVGFSSGRVVGRLGAGVCLLVVVAGGVLGLYVLLRN